MRTQKHPSDTIRATTEKLDEALARWADRDDPKAPPVVRQAANDAMHAIDALLSELHRVRAGLVGEIRRYDDATAARVDALLARLAR